MRILPGLLVLTVVGTAASTQAQSGSTPSKADLQGLVDARLSARNRGDWDGYLQAFTRDATTVSSVGTRIKGHAEIRKSLEDIWGSGVYRGAQTKGIVESVEVIAPNVVLTDGTFEITNIPGGGTRKGRSTTVFVKSGDSWKVAADRSMVPTPIGALNPAR
jgi:uncharacterized protein (TIGR02246 family)